MKFTYSYYIIIASITFQKFINFIMVLTYFYPIKFLSFCVDRNRRLVLPVG